MKYSKLVLLALLLSVVVMATAQNNDPVVVKINKEEIKLSEFKNTFAKNNNLQTTTKADLDNYIDLYVDFRLKYAEALALQLDTITRLQNELAGYREQAASQYLTDKEVDEKIINEACERMKYDIRACHILKQVNRDAAPADTLAAYNEIMKIRKRILNGEDFATVAKETSDDPSAPDKKSAGGELIQYGNHGDLGYFTVFDLVYSFESGAYSTPVGTLSMPIRSEFGYHLIYVKDKKPALGKCRVTQIMMPFSHNRNLTDSERDLDAKKAEKAIKEAYQDLLNGMNFDSVKVKYMGEAANAELPLFGCNRFDGDFIQPIYSLKVGEYSQPVKTIYGWHIIKLLETHPVVIDNNTKASIKSKIMRDSRSNKSKEAFTERVKKENNFVEYVNPKTKKSPVEDFYTALDSNIFIGKFRAEMVSHLTKKMFSIGGKTYTQQDFANYLELHPFTNLKQDELVNIVNFAYKRYIETIATDLENSKLETKYPEFAALMEEYKEGILIYELNDQKVWRKAETDSVGLQNFYETIKDKYKYPTRIQAVQVKCVDAVTAKKAEKLLNKTNNLDIINAKLNKKSVTVVADEVVYWKGQNKDFDKICDWNTACINKIYADKNENVLVKITGILQPSPKPLKEVKGSIISEYQNVLEQQWIEQLHKNNSIWVDKNTIYTILK
jgi:peptidyl-prolyl cis-trans isomerase SurA